MNLKRGSHSRGALKNYSQQSSTSYSQRTEFFRCNYCFKIFRRKDSLTWRQQWKDGSWIHVEEEQQSETSGCTASVTNVINVPRCPKMFKLNTDLTKHQMKHVIIPCPYECEKTYQNEYFLYIYQTKNRRSACCIHCERIKSKSRRDRIK